MLNQPMVALLPRQGGLPQWEHSLNSEPFSYPNPCGESLLLPARFDLPIL